MTVRFSNMKIIDNLNTMFLAVVEMKLDGVGLRENCRRDIGESKSFQGVCYKLKLRKTG